MSIDPLIASLPARTPAERAVMRATAESWMGIDTLDRQDAGRRFTSAHEAVAGFAELWLRPKAGTDA